MEKLRSQRLCLGLSTILGSIPNGAGPIVELCLFFYDHMKDWPLLIVAVKEAEVQVKKPSNS